MSGQTQHGDSLDSVPGTNISDEVNLSPTTTEAQPDGFPETARSSRFIEPGSETRTWRSYSARLDVLLYLACFVSTLVLILNVVGTIVLHSRSRDHNLFHGDCGKAGRIDSALHLLINALSTLLLGASNMSMQFLAAPTRKEVDSAHKRGHWLDIGIPSLHNLSHIAWKRRVLWMALGLSSTPLHFL